jgi:putative ABC transport system permease protein
MRTPVAWLQLKREPVRLSVALAGVTFAVTLVFMQLGFSDALYRSAVRIHQHLVADLILVSPRSLYLADMRSFSRRRLYQALGYDGVAAVAPVYIRMGLWKNPFTGKSRMILVSGFDPAKQVFDLPEVNANLDQIRLPDLVLFDRASRLEYGPVVEAFSAGTPVTTEVADRRISVAGLFELGTSFGIDGTLITSDSNFLRLFSDRPPGLIDIGLITLDAGADAEAVRRRLVSRLPTDVEVLTKQGYMQREKDYWAQSTPIGYVFAFGSIMGLVVGGVIVYQILFADISSHLAEYATLKAMGYTNSYLFKLVLQEALLIAMSGYVPGLGLTVVLYGIMTDATHLPLLMDWTTGLQVLTLTILMCTTAGAVSLGKLRAADPAEIF